MERWTGTPEGTCNVLRTFRETHAISAIVNSTTQNVSIIYQLLFINKKTQYTL